MQFIQVFLVGILLTSPLFAVDHYRAYDAPGYINNTSPFYLQEDPYFYAPSYSGYKYYRGRCCNQTRRKKVIYRQEVGRDACCNKVYEYRTRWEYVDPCKRRRKRGFFRRLFG